MISLFLILPQWVKPKKNVHNISPRNISLTTYTLRRRGSRTVKGPCVDGFSRTFSFSFLCWAIPRFSSMVCILQFVLVHTILKRFDTFLGQFSIREKRKLHKTIISTPYMSLIFHLRYTERVVSNPYFVITSYSFLLRQKVMDFNSSS